MVNLQTVDTSDAFLQHLFQGATEGRLTDGQLDLLFHIASVSPDIDVLMPPTRGNEIPAGVAGVGIYRFVNKEKLYDQNNYRPLVNLYNAGTTTVTFRRFSSFHNPGGIFTMNGTICQVELDDGGFIRRETYRRRIVIGEDNYASNFETGDINGFAVYSLAPVSMHIF